MCSLQSPLPQIRKAPLHAGLELVREAPSSVDFPGSTRPRRPCGTAAPLHTATSQLMHNGRPKRRRTRAPGRVVCSTGCARSFPACPSQRGHVRSVARPRQKTPNQPSATSGMGFNFHLGSRAYGTRCLPQACALCQSGEAFANTGRQPRAHQFSCPLTSANRTNWRQPVPRPRTPPSEELNGFAWIRR